MKQRLINEKLVPLFFQIYFSVPSLSFQTEME